MKKNFEFLLTDEPYKTTTALGKKVQATYDGPRFLVARKENETSIVTDVVAAYDVFEEIDLSKFVEEGNTFFVIDAAQNPFEAAYLTDMYTYSEIPPYEETLPTGEVWRFVYDSAGAIDQVYKNIDLKHTAEGFVGPGFIEHSLTRESILNPLADTAKSVREALLVNDFTDEERAKLENYATWLEEAPTTYKDVDHWKITFPANMPRY